MFRTPFVLAAALVAFPAIAGAPASLEQAVAAQGLQRVRAPVFNFAYVRPGASLAGYDRLLLEPVDVDFRADWQPYRAGSLLRVDATERERVRSEVAQWVQRAFADELQRGTLQPTDQPAPRVLRVKPRVVDLYLGDIGTRLPGRSRVLTTSSGEASLVVELSDASTGEVLARLGDWEELRSGARRVRISDPQRVVSDVESVAANWGRTVREFVAGAR
ncbi:DUF3313 family protein [Ramlibacter algicola]|uniref:DUF3313 family protein n=1 Tax=Ramlibacter algicola TaxID=2795217 RepID=A0A934PZB8_9BURK|nr:DUF3313 family protein [Ramlibacter algicola]MBK0391891.1 DUF3313 family protein [Ramlibacter algicola]